MPKARRRKETSFEASVTKSVFLYGQPNKEKLLCLKKMEASFTALVNNDILLLDDNRALFLQIVKNDKKDPDMRSFEKAIRQPGINSAFCQNAFDMAVTHLSNRLDNIRLDLLKEGVGIFARSKVLFGMSVMGRSREDMIKAMRTIKKPFHQECADALEQMSTDEFCFHQMDLMDRYAACSLEYRIPQLKSVSVPLDSRLMVIEPSVNTAMPYVITVSDPFKSKQRFSIPVDTSRHAVHKIESHEMAGTVMMRVINGDLRITWAYTEKREQPKTSKTVGVDVGITDCLYPSDGKPAGSMKEILDFYHDEVEPAFADLSDLRNKKRAIRHYIRHHDLPEDVRRSLIKKIDRLDQMMQTMEVPYRKKRHYYAMLDAEIKRSVDTYISSIDPETLTVLEKLDIKEFDKSSRVNAMFSTFARGKLQQKLMSALNWKGYDFTEVAPDYTSQTCPACDNLDPANRNGKRFVCTCCGFKDDADHVGSLNIKSRADDKEITELCKKYQYQHTSLQKNLKELYARRHAEWQAASV